MKLYDEKNKFLLNWLKVSFIISVILYVCSLVLSCCESLIPSSILVIPTMLVVLMYFIALKTIDRFPRITKIMYTIMNTIIVVFFQLFVGGIFTMVLSINNEVEIADIINVKDYKKALSGIAHEERIAHFPQQLPEDAKYIKLFKSNHNWFGSEEICLSFLTNKTYIDKELSKYKFEIIDSPNNLTYEIRTTFEIFFNHNFEVSGTKLYIIKFGKDGYHPFSYGIGVKEKSNEIIYYYSSLDI